MILDIYTKNNAFYVLDLDAIGKTTSYKLDDSSPIDIIINGNITKFQNIMSYYKYFYSEDNKNNKNNLKSPKDLIVEIHSEYSNLSNIYLLLVDFKMENNQLMDIEYFSPNKNFTFSFKEQLTKQNIKVTPQNLIKGYFEFLNKVSKNIAAIIPKDFNQYWETIYLNKLDKNTIISPNMRNFNQSINKSKSFVEHPNLLILDSTPLLYKKDKDFNEYGFLTLKTYETYLEKTKELLLINFMNKTADRSTYSNKIWEHSINNLDVKPVDIGKYKPEKKGGFNHALAGVFKNVQFFDFKSYYPSLFLSLNIENEFTQKLSPKIQELLSKRYDIKDLLANVKKEVNDLKFAISGIKDDREMDSSINKMKNQIELLEKNKDLYNGQQLYYKFMINSFIGNLNKVDFKYYYPELYDAITKNGREITKKIISVLQSEYGDKSVVYSDTDSIALNLDLINKNVTEINNQCNQVINEYCEENKLKKGFIELMPDEVYKTFLCPGAKNYLGVKDSGEFKISNMGINTSQNHQELIDLLGKFLIDNIDGKNKASESTLYEKVFELVEKHPEIVFTKNKLNDRTTDDYLNPINQHNSEYPNDVINIGDYYYSYKDENNQTKIFSKQDFINKKFPSLNNNYFAVYNSLLPLVAKTLKILEISNLGAFYKDLGENKNSLKAILDIDYIEKKEDKKLITTNIATNQNQVNSSNFRMMKDDKLFVEQKNKFITLISSKFEDYDLNVVNNLSLAESFKLILSNVQPDLILGDGHPLRNDKNRSFSYTKKGEFYFGHDFADNKSYVLFELIPEIRDDFNHLISTYKEILKKSTNEINIKKSTRSNVISFLDIIKTFEEKPQFLSKDIKKLTLDLLDKMNIYFEKVDMEDFSNNPQEKFSKNDVITNYIPITQIPKNNITTLHKDLFSYLQNKRKIYILPNELPNIFYVCTQQISNFQPNFFFGLKNDLNGFDGRVFDNQSVASLSKTKIGTNSPTSIVSENCKKIIVVEGFMDMLSNIQEMGYKANIGHLSLNGVNQYEMVPYKELLKKGISIQLSLDKDKAGIITTMSIFSKLGIKLPNDLSEIIVKQDKFETDNIDYYIEEIYKITKPFKQLSVVFTKNNLKDRNEELVNFYKHNGIPFAKMKYDLKNKNNIDLSQIHNFCDLMNLDGLKNKEKFNQIKSYILEHIEKHETDKNIIETTKVLFSNVNNFLQMFLPEKRESLNKFIESKGLDLSFEVLEEIAKKYLFTENTLNQIQSGYLSYSLDDIYKNDLDKIVEVKKETIER